MSVGMPWEIRRNLIPLGNNGTRVVDLYTKNGAFGLYTAMLVLSPDHEMGYVVLCAGENRSYLLSYLPDLLTGALLPAAEEAAREKAGEQFTGTFQGPDSHIKVEMDDTLVVRNWTRGDVDVMAVQAALQWPGLDVSVGLRLYPMGLKGKGRMSFRGIWEVKLADEPEANDEPSEAVCANWGGIDSLNYGGIGLDDFEFEVDENGKATGIRPRAMRETLKRVN
jgi:hypothetical protein